MTCGIIGEGKISKTVIETLSTIGEAADMLGVSIPTLRMYEREGLILPKRRGSRHRRYSEADIQRVRCLRRMINDEKISIAGIRRMLSFIPCWKIKRCPEDVRIACPAFGQHTGPCWTMSAKPWECKNADCRACSVYAAIADCQTLKRTIASFTINPEEVITEHHYEQLEQTIRKAFL